MLQVLKSPSPNAALNFPHNITAGAEGDMTVF